MNAENLQLSVLSRTRFLNLFAKSYAVGSFGKHITEAVSDNFETDVWIIDWIHGRELTN